MANKGCDVICMATFGVRMEIVEYGKQNKWGRLESEIFGRLEAVSQYS